MTIHQTVHATFVQLGWSAARYVYGRSVVDCVYKR